jgi:PAS domain S-box-containing protein
MSFSLNNFSIALFISAFIAAIVAYFAYQRRKVYGAKTMMLILALLSLWSFSYGIENLNSDIGWHKFWSYVHHPAIALVPVLWLIFSIQYSYQQKGSQKALGLLVIVPIITILMAWTNDLHGLVWQNRYMVKLSNLWLMHSEHGPYFAFHAFYSYAAIFVGIFFLIRLTIKTGRAYRSQAVIIIITVIVFISGNGLYLLGLLPFQGLDITPFSFTLSCIILSYGLFRHNLLDLMPIANEIILQNIGDGVLVLDNQKRILFINPSFEKMAGLLPETSVGVSVYEVFFNWPDIFSNHEDNKQIETKITVSDNDYYLQVEISPIWHANQLQGSIYVVHDITERASNEEKLRLFLQGREKTIEEYIFIVFDATNSKILEINSAFTVCTGYSPSDIIGKTSLSVNLFSLELRSTLNKKLRQNPVLNELNITIRTKDHSEQHWQTSISQTTINGVTLNLWVAQPIK